MEGIGPVTQHHLLVQISISTTQMHLMLLK